MKKICFHGTNAKAVKSILKIGFKADTWFAKHLEDAIVCGGPHVFEVIIIFDDEPDWQFRVPVPIPKERIISYKVYQVEKIFMNGTLREEVFGGIPF